MVSVLSFLTRSYQQFGHELLRGRPEPLDRVLHAGSVCQQAAVCTYDTVTPIALSNPPCTARAAAYTCVGARDGSQRAPQTGAFFTLFSLPQRCIVSLFSPPWPNVPRSRYTF